MHASKLAIDCVRIFNDLKFCGLWLSSCTKTASTSTRNKCGGSAGEKRRSPQRLRRKAACGVTAAGNRLDWVRREGDSTARAWAALEQGDKTAEEELRPSVGKAVPPPDAGDAAAKELEAVGGVCGGSRSGPPLQRDTGSELRLAPRVGKDGDGASCFLLDEGGETKARLCA